MSDTDQPQEIPIPAPQGQPLSQAAPGGIEADVIQAVNVVSGWQIIKEQHIHLATEERQTLVREQQAAEQEARQRAKVVERQALLTARLEPFVGRATEIAELHAHIAQRQASGGYLIVTGEAGQGKSSIIAKLIVEQGEELVPFHFVRVNAGPAYQTSLLRDLLEQLLLKHTLPAWYMSENYAVLRDSLRQALTEIASQGKQETLFIDGLDLLETDPQGRPDLSFLPERLPAGVVVVVGTRPNKTLDALHTLVLPQLRAEYELLELSRADFALLLQRYPQVVLTDVLSERLYRAMRGNALYLNLVVHVLLSYPDLPQAEVIARVESNPDNIFTVAFSRMEPLGEWREVIRPILGALLVAQEPLTPEQMAHIFGREHYRFRGGIISLGGFVTHVGQQSYTLFHLKLYEYLRPHEHTPALATQFDAREEAELHGKLAAWCGQSTMAALWSEAPERSPWADYRDYARRHYITHLYRAGMHEQLFAVLDDGAYERGKLRVDLSGRASVLDLTLGCQAAARPAGTLAEGCELLTHLWRYVLLRSSLTSQADAYPIEAFAALLALGQAQEALDLAELLTQPAHQLAALILLARYLVQQPERAAEGQQLFRSAHGLATAIKAPHTQARALRAMTLAHISIGQIEQAEFVARSIADDYEQAAALVEVSQAYGRGQVWERAEAIARAIAPNDLYFDERIKALSSLAAALEQAGQTAQAEVLWQEISATTSAISNNNQRVRALYHLHTALLQVRRWDQANTTVRALTSTYLKARALSEQALALTLAGEHQRAATSWAEVQTLSSTVTGIYDRSGAQRVLAAALAQAGRWEQAQAIALQITEQSEQTTAWRQIALSLIEQREWDRSKAVITRLEHASRRDETTEGALDGMLSDFVLAFAQAGNWRQAQELAATIPDKEERFRAQARIVNALATSGQNALAQRVWHEARAAYALHTRVSQGEVMSMLATALVQGGQIEQAKKIAADLADQDMRESITSDLATVLAGAEYLVEAARLASAITDPHKQAAAHQGIVAALLKTGAFEQAHTTALAITSEEERWQALQQVVIAAARAQQWQQAEGTARLITNASTQAAALSALAVAFALDGQFEQAKRIVAALAASYAKEQAWCDVAMALERRHALRPAQVIRRRIRNEHIQKKADCNMLLLAQQRKLAEQTADKIQESTVRDEALYNVALAYMEAQEWEQVQVVANSLFDLSTQETILCTLTVELARAGRWEHALASYNKLQQNRNRAAVARIWGEMLAQNGNDEQYRKILNHLPESHVRASVQAGMAHSMAQNGRSQELIPFIQHAWLQAETKDECLPLLALAQHLVEQYPHVGTNFYDAFAWVDTFLQK